MVKVVHGITKLLCKDYSLMRTLLLGIISPVSEIYFYIKVYSPFTSCALILDLKKLLTLEYNLAVIHHHIK